MGRQALERGQLTTARLFRTDRGQIGYPDPDKTNGCYHQTNTGTRGDGPAPSYGSSRDGAAASRDGTELNGSIVPMALLATLPSSGSTK